MIDSRSGAKQAVSKSFLLPVTLSRKSPNRALSCSLSFSPHVAQAAGLPAMHQCQAIVLGWPESRPELVRYRSRTSQTSPWLSASPSLCWYTPLQHIQVGPHPPHNSLHPKTATSGLEGRVALSVLRITSVIDMDYTMVTRQKQAAPYLDMDICMYICQCGGGMIGRLWSWSLMGVSLYRRPPQPCSITGPRCCGKDLLRKGPRVHRLPSARRNSWRSADPCGKTSPLHTPYLMPQLQTVAQLSKAIHAN